MRPSVTCPGAVGLSPALLSVLPLILQWSLLSPFSGPQGLSIEDDKCPSPLGASTGGEPSVAEMGSDGVEEVEIGARVEDEVDDGVDCCSLMGTSLMPPKTLSFDDCAGYAAGSACTPARIAGGDARTYFCICTSVVGASSPLKNGEGSLSFGDIPTALSPQECR